jgi:hypothetical protein
MASQLRAKNRSLDEWMDLITECRRSGLCDADWCKKNGIHPSSFYNAVSKLRRKACSLPERTANHNVVDLTASNPDVVQFSIIPDKPQAPAMPASMSMKPEANLDNSHTIEIAVSGSYVRLKNDADPMLLQQVITILRNGQ